MHEGQSRNQAQFAKRDSEIDGTQILTIEGLMAGHMTLRQGRLYSTIAALLRRQIDDGMLVPGEQLPSQQALAARYQVALVTIRQAVELLEGEGLVKRRHGSGTYVSDPLPDRRWVTLESGWDALIRMVETTKVRMVRVDDEVQSPTLNENEGHPAPAYRFMRRVHLTDGIPYAVLEIFLDRRLYRREPRRFDREMVIRILEDMEDVEITSARQCLTIDVADFEVAELLNVEPGAPVGRVRRVIRDQAGTAIYVGIAQYRGDVVRLERDLKASR